LQSWTDPLETSDCSPETASSWSVLAAQAKVRGNFEILWGLPLAGTEHCPCWTLETTGSRFLEWTVPCVRPSRFARTRRRNVSLVGNRLSPERCWNECGPQSWRGRQIDSESGYFPRIPFQPSPTLSTSDLIIPGVPAIPSNYSAPDPSGRLRQTGSWPGRSSPQVLNRECGFGTPAGTWRRARSRGTLLGPSEPTSARS